MQEEDLKKMKIRLSREGVFPITRGLDGRSLPTATGVASSGTIQGEGRLAGVPSLFVRLQGCNLRCRWWTADGRVVSCDTSHTWDTGRGYEMEVEEVLELVRQNRGALRHVVVTGGEPMLQAVPLAALLEGLQHMAMHTTVETNGTVADSEVVRHTDLMSISPKLSSSGSKFEGLEESVRHLVGLCKESGSDIQLKFVVACEADEEEIKRRFAESLALVGAQDVFVMPMGISRSDLQDNGQLCLKMSLRNGWRFGPRLHIDLFGNREAT